MYFSIIAGPMALMKEVAKLEQVLASMNANFWGQMSDEYLRDHPEPPPLTDEALAAFEKRSGLKLPKALTELLRIKNGGLLQNTDFNFEGKEFQVTYFKSVSPDDSFDAIRSYADVLSGPDAAEMRQQLKKKAGDPSRLLLVAEPLDFPYAFALNYNRLSSRGEPTVYCVCLVECEEVRVKCLANSFTDFLAGQYFGDEQPTVNLAEVKKYRLIAEGGYEGRYEGTPQPGAGILSGLPVRVRWSICSHRSRLIVFQEIDWAGQPKITRAEIHKSALAFDFPPLESYGAELEPELAEMIRPAIEIDVLSKFDAPLIPDCYELLLHVKPGHKRWVSIETSSPYQGRWKNSKSKVTYESVKSASEPELARVQQSVAANCSELRSRCNVLPTDTGNGNENTAS
jgi:hypothetical protein